MNSQLLLSTKRNSQGKTQLDRLFVSPPFKVLSVPLIDDAWQSGLNLIQMSASPGILAGDKLQIELDLAENTALTLGTQAFTRVQSMRETASAEQFTRIRLARQSRLFYLPHPLVLHKESAFMQRTEIEMAEQSQLIYGEIVAIGRVLNGERFAFRQFLSSLQIVHQNRPLVIDKIHWQPSKMDLTALSQMEDFSHQGSLLFLDLAKSELEIKAILQALYQQFGEPLEQTSGELAMLFGISQLHRQGLMVRVLAHRAEQIEQLFKQIGQHLKQLAM